MKKSNIIFSVLLVTFFISTVGAVGVIPTSYNSEAQSILGMLWRKLDEAIVSNYNARILVRYHDHEGSNPGDFTSRGLPIGTNGIEDSAITGAKLSPVANTKVVSVKLGDMAAVPGTYEKTIWVAPGSGQINRVTVTVGNNITQDNTDYAYFRMHHRRAGAIMGNVFESSTTLVSGVAFTAFMPNEYDVSSSPEATFQENDVYSFYKDDAGNGVDMDDTTITIEYTQAD